LGGCEKKSIWEKDFLLIGIANERRKEKHEDGPGELVNFFLWSRAVSAKKRTISSKKDGIRLLWEVRRKAF